MTDANQREEAVFEAALALQGAERAAYLAHTCAGDPGLRARVEGLLAALERAGGLLAEPVVEREAITRDLAQAGTARPGDRIGPYKLLQSIGEGGCGVVYMAEQVEPVRRRVALKVIKLGMDTRQVVARFEAERQALALMDHPNIAKVFDAGATAQGRPYFVMELVRGIRITEYCDEHELPMRQRLELFIQVCQAVQHAHQKGIIHRDLKPSNILVTVNDGVAVPKVIDFGIAKATTGQALTDKTLFTAFEQFIGTPAYMSPEQALMTSVDIDTRSDIYSLGVLLYELLAGKTPFAAEELLQAGLDEMRRTICEKEPARPSTRLSTMVEGELTSTAKRRRTEAPRLVHLVRGDLDWIVMKCLEKDRARRYETANGLAADLRRHLNNEPVVARPPSRLYEFQKTVRRHKFGFTAVTAVMVALLLGMGVSIHLLLGERSAQRKASAELQRSRQVTAFLQTTLNDVSPELNQGRETKVRDILDRATRRVPVELTNQPELQAQVLSTIAGVYDKLADYTNAERLCREALRLQQSVVGPDHESVAELLSHLGFVQIQRGDAPGAAESLHRAVALMKKNLRQPAPEQVYALANLALLQWESSDLLAAEATLRGALDLIPHVPEAGELAVLLRAHLGRVLWSRGEAARAEAVLQEALDLAATQLPQDHPLLATTTGSLGLAQWDRGHPDSAEKSFRESLDRITKALGDAPHPELANSLNNLAQVLRDRGDWAAAEPLQRRAVDFMMRTVGPEHPHTGVARANLATILRRRGAHDPDQAQSLFAEALMLNPSDELTGEALACALARQDLKSLWPGGSTNPPLWRYTFAAPPTNWMATDFPDETWTVGPAPRGFSNCVPRSSRAAGPRTNIWLRREFELPSVPTRTLAFLLSPNHDARIFVNGVESAPPADWGDAPFLDPWSPAVTAALTPGRNVLAVYSQDADGNAPVEVGLCVSADPSLGREGLIRAFSRLLEQEPARAALLAGRGEALARSGRLAEAALDLQKAIELQPDDVALRFRYALLLLTTSDLVGYQRERDAGLGKLSKPVAPPTAERIARIALLRPAEGGALEVAGRLADQAALADYADAGLAARQVAKALADYRRGHFADAVRLAEKALGTSTQPSLPGWSHERQRNLGTAALLAKAMSYQRMGQKTEAAAIFSTANQLVRAEFPALSSGDLGREWPDGLMARSLLLEAQLLIEGPAPSNANRP